MKVTSSAQSLLALEATSSSTNTEAAGTLKTGVNVRAGQHQERDAEERSRWKDHQSSQLGQQNHQKSLKQLHSVPKHTLSFQETTAAPYFSQQVP